MSRDRAAGVSRRDAMGTIGIGAYTLLPLTIRDAMSVCQRLQERYLRVDSLCIMQDEDKEDWKTQCKTMDMVYANAYLNISATFASDDLSGLFRREKGA